MQDCLCKSPHSTSSYAKYGCRSYRKSTICKPTRSWDFCLSQTLRMDFRFHTCSGCHTEYLTGDILRHHRSNSREAQRCGKNYFSLHIANALIASFIFLLQKYNLNEKSLWHKSVFQRWVAEKLHFCVCENKNPCMSPLEKVILRKRPIDCYKLQRPNLIWTFSSGLNIL